MYRRIQSFESVQPTDLIVGTKFSYPSAIPVDQLIVPEIRLMIAIGNDDEASCWSNLHQIALDVPAHLPNWGKKFFEHDLHRLACVAFSKAYGLKRDHLQYESLVSSSDDHHFYWVRGPQQAMLDDIQNLYTMSYASQLYDEIEVNELKFNWTGEAAHLALETSGAHLVLFDQVRYRLAYEVKMIHLLKILLKLQPFPVYKKILEDDCLLKFYILGNFPRRISLKLGRIF